MTQWGLIHAFMNQSPDFVLGWEAKTFWDACERERSIFAVYHVRNEGELLRIAQHHGLRRISWEVHDETWAFGRFAKP